MHRHHWIGFGIFDQITGTPALNALPADNGIYYPGKAARPQNVESMAAAGGRVFDKILKSRSGTDSSGHESVANEK